MRRSSFQTTDLVSDILKRVRASGRISRVELARALGLAPSTAGIYVERLMAEGFLLTLMGSILGLSMAVLAAKATAGLASAILPWMADFYIRPDILLMCALGTLAVGLLSTFIPAYQASRKPIVEALRAL